MLSHNYVDIFLRSTNMCAQLSGCNNISNVWWGS